MPFNSYLFVGFAAAVVLLYNLVPTRHRAVLLLIASFIFYADASVSHLLVLCLIIAITYGAAIVVAAHRGRWPLGVSIVAVALPLLVFKYYVFLTELMAPFLSLKAEPVAAVLPLGISFLTFQAISYIIDVRQGSTFPERRLGSVALYLAFFPKLLAGPIERAEDFLPQIRALARSSGSNMYVGLKYVLWGFFCKLVVADNIGSIVDRVLRAPEQESGSTLSIVFGLYGFHIYFDFLGYTNIAIGVARCFNIHLNPNFNIPYGARSLREFWRRWHISLSSWFRDYVYIPLGGNTTGGVARVGQISAVFLLSGLWHGAALNFLAWGGFHGAVYWAEEQLRERIRWPAPSTHSALRLLQSNALRVLTFSVVTIGWVFFRLSDVSIIQIALRRMMFLNVDVPYGSINAILTRPDSRWFLVILLSAIALDSSRTVRTALERVPASSRHVIGELAYVNWLVVTVILLGDLGVRDFTYFRF